MLETLTDRPPEISAPRFELWQPVRFDTYDKPPRRGVMGRVTGIQYITKASVTRGDFDEEGWVYWVDIDTDDPTQETQIAHFLLEREVMQV